MAASFSFGTSDTVSSVCRSLWLDWRLTPRKAAKEDRVTRILERSSQKTNWHIRSFNFQVENVTSQFVLLNWTSYCFCFFVKQNIFKKTLEFWLANDLSKIIVYIEIIVNHHCLFNDLIVTKTILGELPNLIKIYKSTF